MPTPSRVKAARPSPAPIRVSPIAREIAKQTLYTLSPSAWSRRELKLELDPWQVRMVDAPAASRVVALTFRQAGKTTAAAVGCAHTMVWRQPRSTSLILAPTQRQSSELIRNLRGRLLAAGERLAVDNTFSVELANGSRTLAVPGTDDAAIRGLSIDGDCVIDEAARVSDALYEAVVPMLIRHTKTSRLILLSTAWARQGFFYRTWSEGDERDWVKIEAKVDECAHISPADLERERRSMAPSAFEREYGNQFGSLEARFFSAEGFANLFGESLTPTPPVEDINDPDPVVERGPAFAGRTL